jgi:hypothetical protein
MTAETPTRLQEPLEAVVQRREHYDGRQSAC